MVPGRLELTIKITELPQAQTVENSWQQFEIDCGDQIVSVTVKPKVWKKLIDAAASYPQWVAAISGKMGEATQRGFVLNEPNIQVFEKKVRAVEEKSSSAPAWDRSEALEITIAGTYLVESLDSHQSETESKDGGAFTQQIQ